MQFTWTGEEEGSLVSLHEQDNQLRLRFRDDDNNTLELVTDRAGVNKLKAVIERFHQSPGQRATIA